MTRSDQQVVDFALNMTRIPRKALRCEIYDTVTEIVDEVHLTNILKKVFGYAATPQAIYRCVTVLQQILDDRRFHTTGRA